MTNLNRQIQSVQRRLWVNRWLLRAAHTFTIAALVFACVTMLVRLYDWSISLGHIAIGLCAAALVASLLWTYMTREDIAFAAARLDEAAGLRERVSSGLFCLGSDDPFARAVVVDAERVSSSLSPGKHIPLSAPKSLATTLSAVVLASLMFLVPRGALKPTEAKELAEQTQLTEQAKIAVKRNLDRVRELAQSTPALEDLSDELEGLSKESGGMLKRPGDIRHEAVKKIDRLADAIGKKRESNDYKAVQELRKMMRGLENPKSDQAPTQKLAKALAAGDFKTAKEEVQALREHLATLKSEEDREAVEKLTEQLDELARQLERVGENAKLAEELQQHGLKKEDIERMLEKLSKKDLDQLKNQLEERGLSREKIEKLTEKLRQRQKAGELAKKLAQAMNSKGAPSEQGADAADGAIVGLTMAAEQLSELEQLEQEMSQLDGIMADLQTARNDIDKPCPACKGTGMIGGRPCSRCQGGGKQRGAGMGRLGQGRGGLAPEEQTEVDFKTERAKVHTGKGAIIGQFLVDSEQVKGDVDPTFAEVISAAERDASDRINRDRVPRQCQKAVKEYFSNVGRASGTHQEESSESSPQSGPRNDTD